MLPLLCLLLSTPHGDAPVLRLQRGQEWVYRGECEETARGDGVNKRRAWRIESRVFVLEATESGAEIALFTVVHDASQPDNARPASVRLMVTTVSLHGRVADDIPLPLGSVAPLDPVAFIELGGGTEWHAADGDRPLRHWKCDGDVPNPDGGGRSLKLVGLQQTPRFEEITEARAWRRRESVWLDPKRLTVQRLERVIEQRDPGAAVAFTRVSTRFQLDSSVTYPSRLEAELRSEILTAWQAQRVGGGAKAQDLAARKLLRHLKTQAPSPYREAVMSAQRELDAARRGEIRPVAAETTLARPIALGEPAPEAMVADPATGSLVRIGSLPGRVAVLLFFRPDSPSAVASLRAAAAVRTGSVAVAALCVTGDLDQARSRMRAAGVDLRLLDGREAADKFGAKSTPRFVVIDTAGVVRELLDGYGTEVPEVVRRAVARSGQTR